MTYPSQAGPGLPLSAFGWTPNQAASFHSTFPALEPGRVLAASRGLALVRTETGETLASPSGRLRQRLQAEDLLLCAGDWLALEPQPGGGRALVHDLLPRGPRLARQEAGPGGRAQVLAANLDVVFLVMGLDRNFNPGRMERLLALAGAGGVRPVILLTKRDLNPQAEALRARMEDLAPGVPVLTLATPAGEGLPEARAFLPPGATGALVGSSGAGKSTLLNALMGGTVNRAQAVRESDDRGRHTTTARELFLLPGGGCLIDTPGIREVGLCGGEDLDGPFGEVAALAAACRYRDCAHGAEPGCAVRAALASGALDEGRYQRYLRLRRESAFEEARADARLWRERDEKWKRIGKLQKQMRKR